MSDKLTEALARHDSHEPIDPDTLDVYVEAARRWASFPSDEDVEAAVKAYESAHLDYLMKTSDARRLRLRAALEAVKREDR